MFSLSGIDGRDGSNTSTGNRGSIFTSLIIFSLSIDFLPSLHPLHVFTITFTFPLTGSSSDVVVMIVVLVIVTE